MIPGNTNAISGVSLFKVKLHSAENGNLAVFDKSSLSFDIERVFTVSAPAKSKRGDHAHIACSQILNCCSGKIIIEVDDGAKSAHFTLDDPSTCLLIPPGIWATQLFTTSNSALVVFCDKGYDERDYIREYEAFLRFKGIRRDD